ncbi:hypothetical protein SUGI_0516810 [Cryptomeria japonica]|nr:hypothetical protein SUGI_0516810 [Cryptomeria japonica]
MKSTPLPSPWCNAKRQPPILALKWQLAGANQTQTSSMPNPLRGIGGKSDFDICTKSNPIPHVVLGSLLDVVFTCLLIPSGVVAKDHVKKENSTTGHVSLICIITPASSNMEETHNTLKFAQRAKRVEIRAAPNKIIDEKSLIKRYQKEILSLKNELDQLRGIIMTTSQEELMALRQQLRAGQVKMQSRLEEEATENLKQVLQ